MLNEDQQRALDRLRLMGLIPEDEERLLKNAEIVSSVAERIPKPLALDAIAIEYHPNGSAGEPFWSILFYNKDIRHPPTLHATLFAEKGYCAVHKVGVLAEDVVGARTRFLGSAYEPHLRKLVRDALDAGLIQAKVDNPEIWEQ
jgi:hypothetical protein